MNNASINRRYPRNIVVDLEFAPIPPKQRPGGLKQEIIEVGAVKLGSHGEFYGEFSRLVRPRYVDSVDWHVRKLTSISEYDLCGAAPLEAVISQFQNWIGTMSARMITWSDSDKNQLTGECRSKNIPLNRFPTVWLDIQPLFPPLMGIERDVVSLKDAAKWYGADGKGRRAHRALADARTTANLFQMLRANTLVEQPGAQTVRRRWEMKAAKARLEQVEKPSSARNARSR